MVLEQLQKHTHKTLVAEMVQVPISVAVPAVHLFMCAPEHQAKDSQGFTKPKITSVMLINGRWESMLPESVLDLHSWDNYKHNYLIKIL